MSQLPLIVGIGNEKFSDDGIALAVARALKARECSGTVVVDRASQPIDLLEAWENRQTVVLICTVKSGAKAGSVFRYDIRNDEIPNDHFKHSAHTLNAIEAVELALILGQLPQTVIIYAIEGKNFMVGNAYTPEVDKAARNVMEWVIRDLRALKSTDAPAATAGAGSR